MKTMSRLLLLAFSVSISGLNPLLAQWVKVDGSHGGLTYCVTSVQSDLLAGTTNGIFRSTNNGVTWQATGPGITGSVMCIAQAGSSLLAGTMISLSVNSSGGMFRSTDDGDHWVQVNAGLTPAPVNGLTVVSHNGGVYVFAATDSGVFVSSNEGMSWSGSSQGLTAKRVVAIAVEEFGVDALNLYAGTIGGGLFFSSDFGVTWLQRNNGLPPVGRTRIVYSLAVTDSGVFAGTAGVYRSTDQGLTWTAATKPPYVYTGSTISLLLAKKGALLLTSDGLLVYRSTDYGVTWDVTGYSLPQNIYYNQTVYSLTTVGESIYAGTTAGIFKSSDNGLSWHAANEGLDASAAISMAASGQHLFVSSASGYYLTHSADNGVHWTPLSGDTAYYKCHLLAANDSVLGVTLDYPRPAVQIFLRYWIGDDRWTSTTMPVTFTWTIAMNSDYLFLTGGGNILRFGWDSPVGTSFSTGFPSSLITVLVADGSNLYGGATNAVLRSTDNGENWSGSYAGGNTTQSINALCASGPNIFTGSTNANSPSNYPSPGIFRSTDGGGTWGFANNGMTDSLINGLVNRGTTVLAGTARQGVFLSVNNGDSWVPFNDGLPNMQAAKLALNDSYIFAGIMGGVYRRPWSDIVTSVGGSAHGAPARFALAQNWPNPFNPSTTMSYAIPVRSHVTISVFNTLGQKVAELVNGEKEAGSYDITFDASGLATGVYLYRMVAGNFAQTKKLVVVK